MARGKESPSKGVSKYWTPAAEEKYERLLAACHTFAERDLIMTIRDLLKYDLRTKEAKRAVEQGRLRLAVATDEDLEELVRLQCQMRGGESNSPDKTLEELKALRAKIRERGIRLQAT